MLSQEEIQEKINKPQTQLTPQFYEQIPNLQCTSESVISRQATFNIGTIGHVSHGKSALVKAISGVNTVKHSQEKIRNITIKLGYANAKIYKCPQCKPPQCYQAFGSDKEDHPKCENENCNAILKLIRHISFVDCPGHEYLMATMITGAAVMDGTLLLIAGNIDCPQPQTKEHLAAVEIMKMENIVIVQNKIDLVFKDKNQAQKNVNQIKKFIKGTIAENGPIVPISAVFKYNIDAVLQAICETIPVPIRDLSAKPKLIIIRSFDINSPGVDYKSIVGGVIGGSILSGMLKVGDDVEIRPGIVQKNPNGSTMFKPIISKIVSLKADNNNLLYAVPGGLIGVGLKVDPSLTRKDNLVGHVLGLPGQLPDVYNELDIKYHLMQRIVGSQVESQVQKIKQGETLMLNIGSLSIGGRVINKPEKLIKVCLIGQLSLVCTTIGEKVAISRRIGKKWSLIGQGSIENGTMVMHSIN